MRLGSAFGAFLDPVADKLMVAATLILLCTKPMKVVVLGPVPWLVTLPSITIIGREVQHPRSHLEKFDLVITPRHDYHFLTPEGKRKIPFFLRPWVTPREPPGRNVFLTIGALHNADASTLRNADLEWKEEFSSLLKPLVVVNIGGPTRNCLINADFTRGKLLFAGVVNGRNIWANDLSGSLKTLQTLEDIVGKEKIVVSTSCSLIHTVVDLVSEIKLDKKLKLWLAFSAQKVVEVNALEKAFSGAKDEVATVKNSDHRRSKKVSVWLHVEQKKLNLPALPTTTIGYFPQTSDLRHIRRIS